MLTGKMQKYEEVYQSQTTNYTTGPYSPAAKEHVEKALAEAEELGIKVGTKVQMKDSGIIGEIYEIEKIISIAFMSLQKPADIYRVKWKSEQGFDCHRLCNIDMIQLPQEAQNDATASN